MKFGWIPRGIFYLVMVDHAAGSDLWQYNVFIKAASRAAVVPRPES
jgi:hypothetical protein